MTPPAGLRRPDYSAHAETYALARPAYPAELFDWLGSLGPNDAAWDCATGSGQAARELARSFARVTATDLSARQIAQAMSLPNVEYRVAPADHGGLPDASVDLITVATAIHWFDLPAFYREVARVLRPGGVLAAWTYHVCYLDPPFEELFARFYRDVLAPYFAPGARLVDDRYAGIVLPGEPIAAPTFTMTARWPRAGLLDFIDSWSGTQAYREREGRDPIDEIRDELHALWSDPEQRYELRWPLFMRAARL